MIMLAEILETAKKDSDGSLVDSTVGPHGDMLGPAAMSRVVRGRAATLTEAQEHICVSDIAVLFTDLKGSSALYRRVGDAAAYRLIRGHFDLLAGIITACAGALVKTIGDAVMAVFPSPHMALKAALAIQSHVGGSNPEVPAGTCLTVKLGIHAGPAITVRLQECYDYFGEVVNMAAQLRDLSGGGEIVISHAVAEDPCVQLLLTQPSLANCRLTVERIALKGSDDVQPVARISRCLKIAAPAPRELRQG